jgi:aerobic carbon-monoxide dehydrogenase small subunit
MKKKTKKGKLQPLEISFRLNNREMTCAIRPDMLLLELIRDVIGLKGTKPGCNEGECGACTVLVNDAPVNSCLYLAVNAHGKNIISIEGLGNEDGTPDPVQASLVNNGAVQCGFCSSGMALSIKGLMNQYEKTGRISAEFKKGIPGRDAIKKWLEGNLCRCTGYVKIIDAAEKLFVEKENKE